MGTENLNLGIHSFPISLMSMIQKNPFSSYGQSFTPVSGTQLRTSAKGNTEVKVVIEEQQKIVSKPPQGVQSGKVVDLQ